MMPAALMMIFQVSGFNVSGTIVVAIVGIGLTWLTAYSATTRANGKSEGKIETLVNALSKNLDSQRAEFLSDKKEQWSEINKAKETAGAALTRVAYVEGRLNGSGNRAHGAGAGKG